MMPWLSILCVVIVWAVASVVAAPATAQTIGVSTGPTAIKQLSQAAPTVAIVVATALPTAVVRIDPTKTPVPTIAATAGSVASSGSTTTSGLPGVGSATAPVPTAGASSGQVDPVASGATSAAVVDPTVNETASAAVVDPAANGAPSAAVVDPAASGAGSAAVVGSSAAPIVETAQDALASTVAAVSAVVASGVEAPPPDVQQTTDAGPPLPAGADNFAGSAVPLPSATASPSDPAPAGLDSSVDGAADPDPQGNGVTINAAAAPDGGSAAAAEPAPSPDQPAVGQAAIGPSADPPAQAEVRFGTEPAAADGPGEEVTLGHRAEADTSSPSPASDPSVSDSDVQTLDPAFAVFGLPDDSPLLAALSPAELAFLLDQCGPHPAPGAPGCERFPPIVPTPASQPGPQDTELIQTAGSQFSPEPAPQNAVQAAAQALANAIAGRMPGTGSPDLTTVILILSAIFALGMGLRRFGRSHATVGDHGERSD